MYATRTYFFILEEDFRIFFDLISIQGILVRTEPLELTRLCIDVS